MPQLAVRLDGARLEPREVEQLPDDAVESRSFGADRLGEAEPVVGLQREPGARERVGRGEDRGERRAEVVETARRSAVLSASLRRSASASSASASSRLRSATTASSAASDGRKRRAHGLVDGRLLVDEAASRHSAARPRPAAPARPGRGGCSPSSSRAPSTPSTPAVSAASRPSSSSSVRPRSRSSAASASACASARRCSASSRRARARAARALTANGDHEVDAEREPVLALLQVEQWYGGRKNQLKASMLATETIAASTVPQRIATGSTART